MELRVLNRLFYCTILIMAGIFMFPQVLNAQPSIAGQLQDSYAQIPQDGHAETQLGDSPSPLITILSIPGLSFEEFEEPWMQSLPNLRKFVQESGVAAMNIRTNAGGLEDVYLSIGAGSHASSYVQFQAMNRDEQVSGTYAQKISAAQLYQGFNGSITLHANIIVPEIGAIRELNTSVTPGLLGETLGQAGIPVTVLGHARPYAAADESVSESSIDTMRFAPLMLMNKKGEVPYGKIFISSMYISDPAVPNGYRMDYAALLSHWREAADNSQGGVVLIELGDLFRLYDQKSHYAPERFTDLKLQTLTELDTFIGHLLKRFEERNESQLPTESSLTSSVATSPSKMIQYEASSETRGDEIWLFSPKVHSDAKKKKRLLAPFIRYDHNYRGLLTSPTTRRTGLISYQDLAPTILYHFNVEPELVMQGQVIQPSFEDKKVLPLTWLLREEANMSKVYQLRPRLLYPFVSYEIAVLAVSLLLLLLRWKRGLKWMNPLLYSILLAPLVMLWMGWGVMLPVWGLVGLFLMALIISVVILSSVNMMLSMGIISFMTSVSILLDGIYGAYGMKHSILGFDPMIGARYYGIGNEYMGVLIGSGLLASMIAYERWMKQMHHSAPINQNGLDKSTVHKGLLGIYLFIFLFVVFFLISPVWGTNAGGAITAAAAFGMCWIRLLPAKRGMNLSLTALLGSAVLLIIAAVAGLWIVNHMMLVNISEQSHIGRAFEHLMQGRWDVISGIIWRKLEMNAHLIGVSSWSKVLLISIFVIAGLALNPKGYFKRWQQERPYMMNGLSSIAAGSVIALLVNDSGIVAAATMIVYAAIPMLLIRMEELQ